MPSKILSLGNAYFELDSIHFPIDKVVLNHEASGSEYDVYAGGSALNFTRICKNLNFETYFIGKIGKDITGEAIQKMLKDENINFFPIISDKHQTNLALNFVGDSGDQYLFIAGTAAQSLEAHELEVELRKHLSQVKYLYLGGVFKFKSLLPSLLEIVEFAQKNNVIVILDHNRITNAISENDKELMKKVIHIVDYYLPSKDELIELYGSASFDDAIQTIMKERQNICVIKDSHNGAIGIKNGEMVKVDAFQVTVRNTIGAGDSFNAGFISATESDMSFFDAIRFGCATAAVNISKSGLPTFDDINNLIKNEKI